MSFSQELKKEIFSFIQGPFHWLESWEKKEYSLWDEFNYRNMFECDFRLCSGACKACILHPDFEGYVVKFCYDTDDDFDYCMREYTNYLAAVANGVEEFFAPVDYLGRIGQYRLFIQEEVMVDEDAVSSYWCDALRSNHGYEDIDEVYDYLNDMPDEERIAISFESEALDRFCDEYVINDVHEGNLGFIGDRLVIFDFSGYGPIVRHRGF